MNRTAIRQEDTTKYNMLVFNELQKYVNGRKSFPRCVGEAIQKLLSGKYERCVQRPQPAQNVKNKRHFLNTKAHRKKESIIMINNVAEKKFIDKISGYFYKIAIFAK
jgi:hypothetical protein